MRKQIIYTIIGLLILAGAVIGGTYAVFNFTVSGNTPINTASSNFEISYVGGGSTFDGPLELVTRKEDGYNKELKIKVANDAVDAKLNLYLEIEEISQNLAIPAFKWEIYGYNSSNVLVYSKNGNFNGASASSGSNIINFVNYDYVLTQDETTFKVYLWLDIATSDDNVLGSTFKGHIAARTEQFTGVVKQ